MMAVTWLHLRPPTYLGCIFRDKVRGRNFGDAGRSLTMGAVTRKMRHVSCCIGCYLFCAIYVGLRRGAAP